MKGAIKFTFALMAVLACTRVFASDPNRTCAESIDRLRDAMVDDSQMARNMLAPFAFITNDSFSTIVSKVRAVGAKAYIEESVMTTDDSKLCDKTRCYSKKEVIDILKPAIESLGMFIDFHDHWLIFEGVQAVGYEPNIQRVTCHLNYFWDFDFLRRFFSKASPAAVTETNQMFGPLEQQSKILRMIGGTFEKRYTIQPDGRGGINLMLLSD